MPRFFFSPHAVCADGQIALSGDDARHIASSLRMRPGDLLVLCDGGGTDYHCVLRAVSPLAVTAAVEKSARSMAEPDVQVTLFIALAKGDKTETVVQKAVELGVHAIAPFLSERCISRPDSEAGRKKQLRLQKIADEAASQCGRGILPAVFPIRSFADAVTSAARADKALFLYENERRTGLKSILSEGRPKTLSLMTGPEGGFAPAEALFARDAGLIAVSMGPRILRCETAPLAALAAAMLMTGNLGQ